MAALPFNLNYSRHFPPLPKPYSRPKQRRHQRKARYHDDTKTVKKDDVNSDQTNIDDLNDTLLELIFITFHWRQLAIFKCVSKRWNSILSNSDFLPHLPLEQSPFTIYLQGTKSYFYENSHTTCLVTEHPYFKTYKFRLGFLPSYYDDDNYVNIVATHKDLLVSYHTLNLEGSVCYDIANPLTKKFIVVPLTRTQAMENLSSLDINFPNYEWWRCTAVGFVGVVEGVSTPGVADCNNDGFRIVRIAGNYSSEIMQIYSSKTGRWTSYLLNYNTEFNFIFPKEKAVKPVTLNNKVYFEGTSQILVIDPFDDDIVAPCVLNLPEDILSRGVLGVSRNRLHIAELEAHNDVSKDYPRIKVWEFVDLTMTYGITKTAELRLVIDFPLKPTHFERVIPPIFRIFPTISRRYWSNEMICCHPYDRHIVYFFYRSSFYRCNVIKGKLKLLAYSANWCESFVFSHPLMNTKIGVAIV